MNFIPIVYLMGIADDDFFFIEGLNNHDVTAYKMLYQRYYKPLVLFVVGYIEDVQVAEDVVEEVVVKLWESDVRFKSLSAFRSYMYSAVKNRALSELKHQDVVNNHATSEAANGIEEDMEYDFSYEEMQVRFLEAVDKLPGRMREVIFCYLEGKSMSEIAKELGIGTESVKTYRKRAFEKLREMSNSIAIWVVFTHFFN